MEIIDNKSTEVSTKEWFLTVFLTAIPVVGFILLLVWAFGDHAKPSKANWAKATLMWLAITVVLYGSIVAIFGAAFLASSIQ